MEREGSIMSTVSVKFKTDQNFDQIIHSQVKKKGKNCIANSAISSCKQCSNRHPLDWNYFPLKAGLTQNLSKRTAMEFNSNGNHKIQQHSASKAKTVPEISLIQQKARKSTNSKHMNPTNPSSGSTSPRRTEREMTRGRIRFWASSPLGSMRPHHRSPQKNPGLPRVSSSSTEKGPGGVPPVP